jgi:uncharacterized membrane protein YedE/YeeE
MQVVAALIAGLLFGAGLTIAQMVDPQKVLGFLDVAGIAKGTWDPTLLMVFIGALPTMFLAYQIRQMRLSKPVLAAFYSVPRRSDIDARLVGGSAVFGIGWGLAGVCPGPAVTALALAGSHLAGVGLFVAAMLAGIVLSWLLAPAGDAADTASTGTAGSRA